MIEDRWVRISALHCSTLGDNLTFYLPELLCHICHWMYSTASYWVLSVFAGNYRCMCGPSAPSSEMRLGVWFLKSQPSFIRSFWPLEIAVAPLVPAHLSDSSRPFRWGPIVKTAWPWEAAILFCQTRFRFHSFLSSLRLPLTWTHPRTLTEVGWPHQGTSDLTFTIGPVLIPSLLVFIPQEALAETQESNWAQKW